MKRESQREGVREGGERERSQERESLTIPSTQPHMIARAFVIFDTLSLGGVCLALLMFAYLADVIEQRC